MPYQHGGRYGGNGGGGRYGGSGAGGGHKKAKKKHSSWLGNLVNDAQEAAAGFIPGIVTTTKAIAHDAKDAVDGGGHNFQSDDIARAISHSYTDEGTTWGEAGREVAAFIRGDLEAARRHRDASNAAFKAHPLAPALDLTMLLTGGAGAGGKIGLTLAKSAKDGGRLQAAGRIAAGLDDAGKARRIVVENQTGGSFTKPAHYNPVIRAQNALFEQYSAARPDGMFGVNRRVGRQLSKVEDLKKANDVATTQAPLRAAISKLSNKLERKSVWILAGGHDVSKLKQMYAKRHRMLEEEIARKKAAKRGSDKGGMHDAEGHVDDDVVIGELPTGEPHLRKPDGDELLAHEGAGPDDLSELLRIDRKESAAKNNRNLAFVKKRLAELDAIDRAGVVANPSKRLTRAAEEARKLSDVANQRLMELSRGKDADVDAEDAMLAQRTASRSTLESRIMRELGVEADAYGGAIRSHVSVVKDKLNTKGVSGASAYKPGGKLDEAQRNTGYNFLNGRDSTNPAIYLHTATNISEQTARLRRHAKLLDAGAWVSRAEADKYPSSKFTVVEANSKLRKDMAEIYSVIVDAEQVMQGTPGYEALRRSMERSVLRPDGSEDMVHVVPTKTYDELVGDMREGSAFVREWLDNPTRLWRNMTLNLRPAWIVNNFVGQLFLLSNAYGIRGLKNYVLSGSKRSRKGKWAEETAPELTAGWGVDANEGLTGLGRSVWNDPKTGPVKKAAIALPIAWPSCQRPWVISTAG